VLVLLALTAPIADATPGWCKRDPVIEVDGKRAHIYVSSLEEILGTVTGPTKVRIFVPHGVSTELIRMDEGFGESYDVRFLRSDDLNANVFAVQILVEVFVPTPLELPVRVEIMNRQDDLLARSLGETNEWITARTRLT
jgi:hypothetical protein